MEEVVSDNFLGDPTWDLAQRMGYERPDVQDTSVQEDSRRRHIVARTSQLERQRQVRTAHRTTKLNG